MVSIMCRFPTIFAVETGRNNLPSWRTALQQKSPVGAMFGGCGAEQFGTSRGEQSGPSPSGSLFGGWDTEQFGTSRGEQSGPEPSGSLFGGWGAEHRSVDPTTPTAPPRTESSGFPSWNPSSNPLQTHTCESAEDLALGRPSS